MEHPDASIFDLVNVRFSIRENHDTLAVEVLLERRTQSLRIPGAGSRLAITLAGQPIDECTNVSQKWLKFLGSLARKCPAQLQRPPAPSEARCEQRDH